MGIPSLRILMAVVASGLGDECLAWHVESQSQRLCKRARENIASGLEARSKRCEASFGFVQDKDQRWEDTLELVSLTTRSVSVEGVFVTATVGLLLIVLGRRC
jgi:hypothetical protein